MKGRITCATSSSLLNEEREPCFVSAQDMPVLSENPITRKQLWLGNRHLSWPKTQSVLGLTVLEYRFQTANN